MIEIYLKLYKMIEIYLKYDNMHTIRTINAFICINNHVNSCINSMLSPIHETSKKIKWWNENIDAYLTSLAHFLLRCMSLIISRKKLL